MAHKAHYHIGFSRNELGTDLLTLALLSGDPQRAYQIADQYLEDVQQLSENRDLHSYLGVLPNGRPTLLVSNWHIISLIRLLYDA